MEIKDLRAKTEKELQQLLALNREKVRALRFSVSSKQLKNIREIREVKKLIARIMTVLKEGPAVKTEGKAEVSKE
jgi:ribosomal protein L29